MISESGLMRDGTAEGEESRKEDQVTGGELGKEYQGQVEDQGWIPNSCFFFSSGVKTLHAAHRSWAGRKITLLLTEKLCGQGKKELVEA